MSSYRFGPDGFATDNMLEPLLNSLPDIIHSVDKDGKIVFANKRATELLGYTHEELIGFSIFDLYAPELRNKVKKGFKRLRDTGDLKIRESLIITKSGEIIPVEIRSFGVYDENGEFIRTFSMLRDIRAMKEMQDSMMHSERLSGIGQLASCVVHDIHNPLMVIQLYAEMMAQDTKRIVQEEHQDDVSEYLNQIQRASEKIQKLLNHLRNFSRRKSEAREKAELNNLLDDALFMVMNKTVGQKITIERTNNEDELFTYGAPIQLEQVLMNIMSNACDAMVDSEEKKLTISVCEREVDEKLYSQCTISDTGSGIKKENLKDIFNPFFTTKKLGKGTGIGLSTCKEVLENHEGKVEVESEVGKGTTFRILFLQKPDDLEPSERAEGE
jgi:PAS domain S-box-containing protein